MKAFKFVLYLFLVSGLFWACIGEDSKSVFHFYRDQTYCADPWGYSGGENSALKIAVEDYLIDQGILGAKVTFFTEEGLRQDCFACHCTSGIRIYVQVPFQFRNRIIELGFKEV
ncbi:hypothetical protein SAMN04488104_100618 [Algoriphagus faecimaris]|uniref:Uncharacterized protein n=1 Tax=Algoriphagus faecimaris TaxID=686796 RepID=A0A1G6PHK9_9BACT|nr:hypothetical protein [Algoriphagus faecimaris]SDC79044.1 hypothetical protein SAMN04488104_100618 [Algoriphagus faecimaris]